MSGFTIKLQSPIVIKRTWKIETMLATRAGRMIDAIRIIYENGPVDTLKEAREYYEKHYAQYYRIMD